MLQSELSLPICLKDNARMTFQTGTEHFTHKVCIFLYIWAEFAPLLFVWAFSCPFLSQLIDSSQIAKSLRRFYIKTVCMYGVLIKHSTIKYACVLYEFNVYIERVNLMNTFSILALSGDRQLQSAPSLSITIHLNGIYIVKCPLGLHWNLSKNIRSSRYFSYTAFYLLLYFSTLMVHRLVSLIRVASKFCGL